MSIAAPDKRMPVATNGAVVDPIFWPQTVEQDRAGRVAAVVVTDPAGHRYRQRWEYDAQGELVGASDWVPAD